MVFQMSIFVPAVGVISVCWTNLLNRILDMILTCRHVIDFIYPDFHRYAIFALYTLGEKSALLLEMGIDIYSQMEL